MTEPSPASTEPSPASTAPAPENEQEMIEEGKIFALLAYLGILCLVPLLAKKDNKFAYYHAKQGLILFITEVVVFFAIMIISMLFGILTAVIHFLGFLFSLFFGLVWLAFVVAFLTLSIIGIVQSLNGKYWEMPILGQYAKKLNF